MRSATLYHLLSAEVQALPAPAVLAVDISFDDEGEP
jgi:hypothetical protein